MEASLFPARWWHPLDDGRLQCDLCPRDCKLGESQRGACFVRQNLAGGMVLTTYGRSSGFCIDPIEKKPLNHFYPGSSVLSFGTAGCNLMCKFCQNWDISKSRDMDRLMDQASPEGIARAAQEWGCRSVAFTYNDPVVFAEYAMDVADACHERGIQTVAVTAGYIHPEPRRDFYAKMDAANVDLKAFTEDFYSRLSVAHLQPVLDTLRYIRHETDTWLEITTLLIPGQNDSGEEIKAMTEWIARELGPDVPLHFSAFHPDYKMMDAPATPKAALTTARA
ncbi:MAG: AmmeMemoRadiSam system radical SAM enzyme, partial [Acidobacteriota bacterium]|nr:AmmeMemoRadiSam system radical SAM enzyme [Acidobacteriota bacterium]